MTVENTTQITNHCRLVNCTGTLTLHTYPIPKLLRFVLVCRTDEEPWVGAVGWVGYETDSGKTTPPGLLLSRHRHDIGRLVLGRVLQQGNWCLVPGRQERGGHLARHPAGGKMNRLCLRVSL